MPARFSPRLRDGGIPPFPTSFGSGVALLEYCGDGWLDVDVACGRNLGLDVSPPTSGNRVYQNRADGTFEGVMDPSGSGFRGFNPGRAVGDVDNDGFPDLYRTYCGPNVCISTTATARLAMPQEVRDSKDVAGRPGSAHDARLLVGLGTAARVEPVEVRWPSGRRSTLMEPRARQTYGVREPRRESAGGER